MKNIAVFVSGGGTNLQALIDAQKNNEIKNGRITLVLSSNNDAYALTRAKENNIKTAIVSRKEYKTSEDFDNSIIDILQNESIDLIVLAGFMSIIGESLINKYKNAIINVHPALIPSFCGKGFYGLKVHEAVLEYGVKVTGATVHFVNEIPDGGAIILQKAIYINPDETPNSLQKRVMEEAEWKLLPLAVSLFCDDKIQVIDNKVIFKDK